MEEFYAAEAALIQTDAVKGVTSIGSTMYGILYFVFMSAVILGAAYFVTRFLASKGFKQVNNKNLKIVETINLGIDKSLLLVKVGEQYLLLGSMQKRITMLAEIEQGKLNISSTKEAYSKMNNDSIETFMDELQDNNNDVYSIKQNLNRLKSIVRGNKTDV